MMTPDALVLGDMFQFAAGPHNPPLIRTVRDVGADRVDFRPALWDGPLPRGTWSVSMEEFLALRPCCSIVAMDAMTIQWAWTNGMSPEECAATLDERHGKESKPPSPAKNSGRGGRKTGTCQYLRCRNAGCSAGTPASARCGDARRTPGSSWAKPAPCTPGTASGCGPRSSAGRAGSTDRRRIDRSSSVW